VIVAANAAIFQLYYGEKKLPFNEIMMKKSTRPILLVVLC